MEKIIRGIKRNRVHDSKGNSVNLKEISLGIVSLFAPIIIVYILFSKIIGATVIVSASMEPALMTGNTVFINRLAYINKSPERGDIIVFWSDEFHSHIGKRIIGLPGDTIEFKNGSVVINGEYADESAYIEPGVETNSGKSFTVPAGCCFLLGDNREGSYDSRYWTDPYIPIDDITGKYIGQIDFSLQYDILNRLQF